MSLKGDEKMRRKIGICITALLTAGLMAGCTGNSNQVAPEPADTKEETHVVEEQPEEVVEEPEEEIAPEEGAPMVGMSRYFDYTLWSGEESADWLALYESFLMGEETVTVGGETPYLEEGYYTLTEVVEGIQAGLEADLMPNELLEEYYGLIDGGNDGYPELVIKLPFSDPDNREAPVEYLIIRPYFGELSLMTIQESFYRSQITIGEYGFIVNSGSGGASNSGSTCKVITSDGELYTIYTEMDYYSLGNAVLPTEILSDSLKEAVDNEDCGSGSINLRMLDLAYESEFDSSSQYEEYRTDFCKNCCYAFFNSDGSDVDVDEAYVQLCADNGLQIISNAEFDAMIDSACEEYGATKDIRAGEEPDWDLLTAS